MSTDSRETQHLGVVVIGRNEGERLGRCLRSVVSEASHTVYVDSGSSDGSVALAQSLGVEVVNLDLSRPFTAARARNAGLQRLSQTAPELQHVFFVDGDCEVAPGFIATAADHLDRNPRVAVVCGRRRERFPDNSIYNRLCDIEWDAPVGPTKSCGGDAVFRIEPLRAVSGYRESLIAGEEPELCARLRAQGWQVVRLGAEMTLHDAAILRFGQWWKRAQRGGHAYAEGAFLHPEAGANLGRAEIRRAFAWGLGLPAATLAALLVDARWVMLPLAVVLLQVVRLALRYGGGEKISWVRAVFMVIAKFPEALGGLQYHWNRRAATPTKLIEYK